MDEASVANRLRGASQNPPLESRNKIAFDWGSCPSPVFSRRKPSRTCLADIEQYFRQPPPQFLDLELAVCWILECLLKDDNYPSGLLQKLIREEPQLRLSETVLQQALDFLEQQGSIAATPNAAPVEDGHGACCTFNPTPAAKLSD